MAGTRVTFIATSAATPGAGHDTASFVLNGTTLVDTGWYAPLKMLSCGLDPLRIERLVLTHGHHDHYLGLPALLFYRGMRGADQPGRDPLRIIGPKEDLEKVVNLAKALLQPERFQNVACAYRLVPLAGGDHYEEAGFRLDTCPSIHPVPRLCFRYHDKQSGAVIAFSGDTAYNTDLVRLAKGADLLIHEASYGPNAAPTPNTWLHSGAPEAAKVAAEANVKRLALVHCSETAQKAALDVAKKTFAASFWPSDGETIEVRTEKA